MAYIPTNWINRKTQLNADNMNKIEQELARLSEMAGGIKRVLEGPGIYVTPGINEVTVGLRSSSSEDNLLVLDSVNGLMLTLSLTYDPETRKLVLSSGSGWSEEIEFDVDKALVDGNYDPDTRNIVLTMSDGSDIIIDMSRLEVSWKLIGSDTIEIVEGEDAFGFRTFTFRTKISSEEFNNLEVKPDGMYSQKLLWDMLGISDEDDGGWEDGNKFRHFVSGKCVSVRKIQYNNLDYYDFNYIISDDEGNFLVLKDGKLFIPELTPEQIEIIEEIDAIKIVVDDLFNMPHVSTKTISLVKTIDSLTREIIVTPALRVSTREDNEIYEMEDGLMAIRKEVEEDNSSIKEVLKRLTELEKETPRMRREIEYLEETAKI